MFYTNVIHRPASRQPAGRSGDAHLRDALGELMVEASGYRGGRCTVELNAALDRARMALAPTHEQVLATGCVTRIVRRRRAVDGHELTGGEREASRGAAGDN